MSRMISTVMLFIVTLVVGILFYRVMVGFFVPLFLAALLVVIFRPVHEWIGKRFGGRPRVAALTTTIAIMLVVLLPAVLVIGVAAAQGTSLISRVNYNSMAFALERTRTRLGLDIENPEPFERLPALVLTLSETDSLDDARQRQRASARIREINAVLATLETEFEPLDEETAGMFATSRETLDTLQAQLVEAADRSNLPGRPSQPAKTSEPTEEATGTAPASDGAPSAEEASANSAERAEEVVEPEPVVPEFRSPEERFQRTLSQLDSNLRHLGEQLLGGSFRAQLKMLANPSREKIDGMFEQAQSFVQARLLSVTSATGEFLAQMLIGVTILVITLYFFLVDGPGMVRTLMRLSPLDDRYEHKLLMEFDRTSRAVVLATVLSALAQGILATFGYYFAGLGSIVLLFLLTSFMALIPFLGAASIWLPCCLWLGVVEERWAAAIALAIYGTLAVSSVDNVIKVFVLHGRSQLHPLLALLSVLGGVQVFGPIGILVGPMVVVFLQTTLEILNHELSNYGTNQGEGGLALAGESEIAAEPPSTNPPDTPPDEPEKPKTNPTAKPKRTRRK